MKRIVVGLTTLTALVLTGCGQSVNYDITPLDDNPTPSCIAVSRELQDNWDYDRVEDSKNYNARYCLADD